MNIAMVRYRPFAQGGAETTLRYLVRGFLHRGHEVRVYGAGPAPPEAGDLLGGVRYAAVPVRGGKAGRVLSFALHCRRLLRQGDQDVVLSLERTLCQQVYRAGDGCHREWLARRAAVQHPLAHLTQHLRPLNRVLLYLERRLFTDPGLRRVIANSRQVQEEIQRHYGVDAHRIRVIYNGLDRRRFRPLDAGARRELAARLGAPADAAVVLFVGSGFRRKGLAWLMQAFAGAAPRSSLLWVVGKDDFRKYDRLAARLRVADRVKFWGLQSDAAPFYQAAAVLALPTLYDPCSNVVLEALACGTPVITTQANGAAEFLTPGVNGAVIPRADDVGNLRQALSRFLEAGRDDAVRRGAAAAVAHLEWETTVAQTLACLEEAAAR